MGDKLNDKVAIVTGAGRGIGRAIAISIAGQGASVVVNDIGPGITDSKEETDKYITGNGGKAIAFYGDIGNFEVARDLVDRTVSEFGSIHILVNNAGVSGMGMPWEISEKEWDKMIHVHLKGTFNCTHHVTKIMKEQLWGRIVNCTSGAWISRSGGCHYAAAKAGVVGFTRAIAADMIQYNVTCNAYWPMAKTDMIGAHTKHTIKERFNQGKISKQDYEWQMMLFDSNTPLVPEAVGELVAYLSTDEAGFINGRTINVGGGRVAIYSEPAIENIINKNEGMWTVEELIERMPILSK